MVLFIDTAAFFHNLDEDFIEGRHCHFKGIELDALRDQLVE